MAYTILRVVRRDPLSQDTSFLSGDIHPVLRRIYTTRGVRTRADLDVSLERLLPVGTLEGVPAAVDVLLQHRTGRILVVGDFDADGATSTALMGPSPKGVGLRIGRFPRPEPLPVRLRSNPGNRRVSRDSFTHAYSHGRQRHLEHRWRRPCARAGYRCPHHRPPSGRY